MGQVGKGITFSSPDIEDCMLKHKNNCEVTCFSYRLANVDVCTYMTIYIWLKRIQIAFNAFACGRMVEKI